MSHDDFEDDRYRVERVLEILEHAVGRLDARAHVSVPLLKDAVTFLRRAEEAEYEAAQVDDSKPMLSACAEYQTAARLPLAGMEKALRDLERGGRAAEARFARSARQYIDLRRGHLRLDDRLFASAQARRRAVAGASQPVQSVETPDTHGLYDRLVEAAAILHIGAPSAFPAGGEPRVGNR
jgi:hemerythrin-like domain-containing protein